jgi:hypothetical protein
MLAKDVITELGITEPDEIDLDAIAWHLGVTIKDDDMDGCEACIIGGKDKAIIRVSTKVSPERRKFSIGHELGHWCHHRNQSLFSCKAVDIGSKEGVERNPKEKQADRYASDLLMPLPIFSRVARQHRNLTWDMVRQVGKVFGTSLPATAIKLIEADHTPSVLVSHGKDRRNGRTRRWFSRSKSVPERWFPKYDIDSDSPAFDVLYGKLEENRMPMKVDAGSWFDQFDANRYQITEQSVRIFDGDILTLLVIKDEKMLQDRETRSWSGNRH